MKYFPLLVMILLAVPLASASDANVTANITLDDNFTTFVTTSATAVGYVNVTLVEPPVMPITGLFLDQFDFAGFSDGLSSFFGSLLSFFS